MATKKQAKSETLEANFEKQLEKLEQLVDELESGDLGLPQAIKKFEEGVGLYKQCRGQLDKAEKKVAELSANLKEKENEDQL